MNDLPLTKVSETDTTITLGWTPIQCEGYEFLVDGKRASNTFDSSRSSVKFKKTSTGKYSVRALGVIAEGAYPPVIQPPPAGIVADAWQVDMRLNQTNEGVHSGAWVKSWRKAPSGFPADWDEQGIILFKDFPDKYWMVTGTKFVSGYPGRFHNFHLVGGDAAHGGVSPLSLDYHPGRSNDWPSDVVPGVVLTCEAELDDHRRGHWQVLTDAEARGGEFTFVWEIGWRQNTSGSVNLEVHKAGQVVKRVSVTNIKTAYDNQQPMLFTWLGAYESNGDQKSTSLQTLDYRGRTLAEAKADVPLFGSIWHTTGPNGNSDAVKDGTLVLQ